MGGLAGSTQGIIRVLIPILSRLTSQARDNVSERSLLMENPYYGCDDAKAKKYEMGGEGAIEREHEYVAKPRAPRRHKAFGNFDEGRSAIRVSQGQKKNDPVPELLAISCEHGNTGDTGEP